MRRYKKFKISEKAKTRLYTGTGLLVLLGSNICTGFATVKAIRKIDEIERDIGKKLSFGEKVKCVWHYYIPTAGAVAVGSGLVISSDVLAETQIATMATSMAVKQIEEKNYKQEVVKEVGEEKEKEISKQAEKNTSEEIKSKKSKQMLMTSSAELRLFRNPIDGVLFWADQGKLYDTILELDTRLKHGVDDYITLSEIYDELDVEFISYPKIVSHICWDLEHTNGIYVDFNSKEIIADDKTAVVFRLNPPVFIDENDKVHKFDY